MTEMADKALKTWICPDDWTTNLNQALWDLEYALLEKAIRLNHWNTAQAAKALGIKRTTMMMKLKRYGINRPGPENTLEGTTQDELPCDPIGRA